MFADPIYMYYVLRAVVHGVSIELTILLTQIMVVTPYLHHQLCQIEKHPD